MLSDTFLNHLTESYKQYLLNDPRSNKKFIPIHKGMADILLIDQLTVASLGHSGKYKYSGQFYDKNLDIVSFSDLSNFKDNFLGYPLITYKS
jgi:hypothetical protein